MGASSAKLAKLQQIYEALDEDRDGELTIEELEVWAKDEVFLGNHAFAKRFASFSSVAEELDVNGDGKVSLKELGNYFADVSDEEINLVFHSILADKEKLTSQLSDLIFQMMDRDASGLIEYSEFVDWAKKSGVFGPVQDRDSNDVKLEAKLKRAFTKLDSDQSSAINKDEFRKFMEGRSVRSIRHMYHEFLDGRRSESNADWVATRTESTWSAFWFASRVDAADSARSGEFLHAFLGALTPTFSHPLFPARYTLLPDHRVTITFVDGSTDSAAFDPTKEQLTFEDGRVWKRYHDARKQRAAVGHDLKSPSSEGMRELMAIVNGDAILSTVHKFEDLGDGVPPSFLFKSPERALQSSMVFNITDNVDVNQLVLTTERLLLTDRSSTAAGLVRALVLTDIAGIFQASDSLEFVLRIVGGDDLRLVALNTEHRASMFQCIRAHLLARTGRQLQVTIIKGESCRDFFLSAAKAKQKMQMNGKLSGEAVFIKFQQEQRRRNAEQLPEAAYSVSLMQNARKKLSATPAGSSPTISAVPSGFVPPPPPPPPPPPRNQSIDPVDAESNKSAGPKFTRTAPPPPPPPRRDKSDKAIVVNKAVAAPEFDPSVEWFLLGERLTLSDRSEKFYVLTSLVLLEYAVDGDFDEYLRRIPISSITNLMISKSSLQLVVCVRSDIDIFVTFDSDYNRQHFIDTFRAAFKRLNMNLTLPVVESQEEDLSHRVAKCATSLELKLKRELSVSETSEVLVALDDSAAAYASALKPSLDGAQSRYDFLWHPLKRTKYATAFLVSRGEREAHVVFSSEIEPSDTLAIFRGLQHLVMTLRSIYVFQADNFTAEGLLFEIPLSKISGLVVSNFKPHMVVQIRSAVDVMLHFQQLHHGRLSTLIKLLNATANPRDSLLPTRVDESELAQYMTTAEDLGVKLAQESAKAFQKLQLAAGGASLHVSET